MSEPGGPLLLAAHQCNPVIAATAEALPDVWVSIHAASLLRLLEGVAGGGADAVREALVIPEGRVLEDQPSARLADTTPSLSLVAVAANPSWRVEVTLEAQLLLVGNHVRVLGVHILGWRGNLLLVQGRK